MQIVSKGQKRFSNFFYKQLKKMPVECTSKANFFLRVEQAF